MALVNVNNPACRAMSARAFDQRKRWAVDVLLTFTKRQQKHQQTSTAGQNRWSKRQQKHQQTSTADQNPNTPPPFFIEGGVVGVFGVDRPTTADLARHDLTDRSIEETE